MTRSRNRNWFLAAVAAASLISAPAIAQVAASQDGHAMDSNNRVGSGGYNSSTGGGGVTQNQIIYNNVTGGIGFAGPHTADPRQFLGPSPGRRVDDFVRSSGGIPTPYQPPVNQSSPTAYYGASRYVPPPIGTERLGYTGGYIGTDLTPRGANFNSLIDNTIAATSLLQQRLGETSILGAGSKVLENTELSDFNNQGALDAQIQPTIYANSPLFGLQPLPGAEGSASGDQNLPLYGSPSGTIGGVGRQRLRQNERDRLRQELNNSTDTDQTQSQNQSQNQDQNLTGGAFQAPRLNKPFDAPSDANLNARANKQTAQPAALSSGLNTQEIVKERLTLVPARQQSKTLAILQDRLKQYQSPQYLQIKAAVDQNNARAAMLKGGKNPTSQPAGGLRSGTGLGGGLGMGSTADRPATMVVPPANVPATEVASLADGVAAKGLHDLLLSAEDLMRQGKFQSAINKYNNAEDVAPNNSLIPLGRANAELGAGYYNQATVDLRQAFQSDPALLLGRYDLDKWISDKRLQFITQELSDLAAGDKTQEMPVFLLAYLSYNTGQDAKALEYLKEAQKRAGTSDPVLAELETRWKPVAPATPPAAPDLNK
jgi:hypothetical protein